MNAKDTDIIRMVIAGYSHDGAGVGRFEGQVVFVPGAIKGEEILAEVTTRRKGTLQGKLTEIIKPSPDRVKPACGIYGNCGGCQLQHMSYPAQLSLKQQTVRDALNRIGGLREVNIRPIIGQNKPWGYRNKGQFRVGRDRGKVILGFVEEGTHQIVGSHCRHLFSAKVVQLLDYLEGLLSNTDLKIYDQDGEGLRHVLVRESSSTGEILLVFVHTGGISGEIRIIAREICRHKPEVVGICENINTMSKGAVLGKKTGLIQGKGEIEDRIGPFVFTISPSSFFQVNSVQTEVLYNKAVEYAMLSDRETVVDAYSGIGTISLFLAHKAARVIGIESVPEAVADARKNALRNGVNNVEFIMGQAEKCLPRLVEQGMRPEAIVVDPPRKGCDRLFLDSLIKASPDRVVYVSCNPATLARDLKYLAEHGYQVKEVQPVDMFPQTYHVECIVQIKRAETRMR